jgi:hypothetical protein
MGTRVAFEWTVKVSIVHITRIAYQAATDCSISLVSSCSS